MYCIWPTTSISHTVIQGWFTHPYKIYNKWKFSNQSSLIRWLLINQTFKKCLKVYKNAILFRIFDKFSCFKVYFQTNFWNLYNFKKRVQNVNLFSIYRHAPRCIWHEEKLLMETIRKGRSGEIALRSFLNNLIGTCCQRVLGLDTFCNIQCY